MRIRSTSTEQNVSFQSRVYNILTGTTNGIGNHTVPARSSTSMWMSDVVTPGFRKRSAAGEVIVNPMTKITSKIETGGNGISYTQIDWGLDPEKGWVILAGTGTEILGEYSPRLRVPWVPIALRYGTAAWTEISTKFNLPGIDSVNSSLVARVQANAANSEAQMLVTLAEMNKSIDMVWNGAVATKRVVDWLYELHKTDKSAFSKLRNLRFRDMKKAGLEAASIWLAYRYGIMATYYDAMSWCDASAAVGKARRARFTSSAQTDYHTPYSESVTYSTEYSDTVRGSGYSRTTKSKAGCLVTVETEQSVGDTYGVKHVLSAVWELVPFSFVIDWFIDISERLAAFEGQWIRPVLGSWIVHRSELQAVQQYRQVGKTTIITPTSKKVGTVTADNAVLTDNSVLVTRIANPQLSVLPEVRVNLNFKKVLDGIALAAQQSKRLKSLL